MLIAYLRRLFSYPDPTVGSALLFFSALTAIVLSNSNFSETIYDSIIHFSIWSNNSKISTHLNLQSIVNDGFMTLFFLAVGLELKYELLDGALNNFTRAALPAIAALGGMVIPVLIYNLIISNMPILRSGWAIPAATDIAFAVGVLSLLGSRVPTSLKVFLLALAIIDDLGAIIIIALFYNSSLNQLALVAAVCVIGAMVLINYVNIKSLIPYLFLGMLLWSCIMLSGIHATLAGVIVGGLVPLKLPNTNTSPARVLEHRLQLWLIYFILPTFAFVNSGISLQGISLEYLVSLLPLGISIGLVVGKPLGIMLFTAIAVKLKLAKLPSGVSFFHIAAVSVLCGIGFTMSIFIANLAFRQMDPIFIVLSKIGILSGSITSAILGYFILLKVLPLRTGK